MRTECMGTPEVWDTMADMVRLGRVMRGCIMNIHCKNKRVVLTQLGYLSCSFTAKECTYKQIS